jgi:hypothetical protein
MGDPAFATRKVHPLARQSQPEGMFFSLEETLLGLVWAW